MNEELKDKFEEVYAESMWRGDSQVLWDWFKEHADIHFNTALSEAIAIYASINYHQ